MLKEAAASKAAKLLMTCVCPVAGTTALSLASPKVRDAVHKATQPRQYAKPKTRVRAPGAEGEASAMQMAAADEPCPTVTPFALSNLPETSVQPLQAAPQQLAEGPSPDVTNPIPLTPRIFVPPAGGNPVPQGPGGVPEPETWVQLVLGFGIIGGVARVSYRRNGGQQRRQDPFDAWAETKNESKAG
ncbi:hypothetical protein [Sphingomonas montanisoli]|uniref:hypothetical protein n=1 Tax=Sphingomonas montanisoli TaxID=2606412 RepID=UPI001FE3CFF6|nr:hypothetical protein [Sphingomonas montanisoli]